MQSRTAIFHPCFTGQFLCLELKVLLNTFFFEAVTPLAVPTEGSMSTSMKIKPIFKSNKWKHRKPSSVTSVQVKRNYLLIWIKWEIKMQDPGCSKKPAHLHISTGSVVSVAILFSSSFFSWKPKPVRCRGHSVCVLMLTRLFDVLTLQTESVKIQEK